MGEPQKLATTKADIVQKLRDEERKELEKAGAILQKWEYNSSDIRFWEAAKLVVKIARETNAELDEVVKTIRKRMLYTERNLLEQLVKEKKMLEQRLDGNKPSDNQKLQKVPKKTENFWEKIVGPLVEKIDERFVYTPKNMKERIEHLNKHIEDSKRRISILEKFEDIYKTGEPGLRDGARFLLGED